MVEKKAERKRAKEAVNKPDSVEIHGSKPMPPIERMDIVRVEQHYEGPVPRSEELARYKEVQKDLPERMMRMAEKEQEKRHKHMDSMHDRAQKKEDNENRLKDRGQWLAAVLILAIVGAATAVAINSDKELPPILFAFMGLTLLVAGHFGQLASLFTKDKNKKK